MRRTLILLSSCAALTACVSVLPTPEAPTALYRIGPFEQLGGVELSSHVLITEPEAPALLGSRSMAVQTVEGGYGVLRSVQWTDSATRLMQLGLLDALSQTKGSGLAISSDTGARAPYELRWRISDYSVRDGVAHCDLALTLMQTRSRQPIAQTLISSSEPVASFSGPAQAQGLQQAARASVQRAAQFIVDEVNAAEVKAGETSS